MQLFIYFTKCYDKDYILS